MLTVIYQGPPLEGETDRLVAKLGGSSDPDKLVSWEDVLAAVNAVRRDIEEYEENARWSASSGAEFTSNEEFRDYNRRHIRLEKHPNEKYSTPLTAQQDLGWQPTDPNLHKEKVHGKKSCPETVYASELVKSGVIF